MKKIIQSLICVILITTSHYNASAMPENRNRRRDMPADDKNLQKEKDRVIQKFSQMKEELEEDIDDLEGLLNLLRSILSDMERLLALFKLDPQKQPKNFPKSDIKRLLEALSKFDPQKQPQKLGLKKVLKMLKNIEPSLQDADLKKNVSELIKKIRALIDQYHRKKNLIDQYRREKRMIRKNRRDFPEKKLETVDADYEPSDEKYSISKKPTSNGSNEISSNSSKPTEPQRGSDENHDAEQGNKVNITAKYDINKQDADDEKISISKKPTSNGSNEKSSNSSKPSDPQRGSDENHDAEQGNKVNITAKYDINKQDADDEPSQDGSLWEQLKVIYNTDEKEKLIKDTLGKICLSL